MRTAVNEGLTIDLIHSSHLPPGTAHTTNSSLHPGRNDRTPCCSVSVSPHHYIKQLFSSAESSPWPKRIQSPPCHVVGFVVAWIAQHLNSTTSRKSWGWEKNLRLWKNPLLSLTSPWLLTLGSSWNHRDQRIFTIASWKQTKQNKKKPQPLHRYTYWEKP